MSLYDDQLAEFDNLIDQAEQKCLYGRAYSPAYELARWIRTIRYILKNKEEGDADPELNCAERSIILKTAGLLLISALTETKKLREVADALDAEKSTDPRQANILKAYELVATTKAFPPTLAELRGTFQARFGENLWPAEFSVRKTLTVLGLPLRKDKRGRPKIRNQKRR